MGSGGSSCSGLISICIGMEWLGGALSGCGCDDDCDDSSWNENKSWAGVDETSHVESYMGSSSSPAKFSLAYLDGVCVCFWVLGLEWLGCVEDVVWL